MRTCAAQSGPSQAWARPYRLLGSPASSCVLSESAAGRATRATQRFPRAGLVNQVTRSAGTSHALAFGLVAGQTELGRPGNQLASRHGGEQPPEPLEATLGQVDD